MTEDDTSAVAGNRPLAGIALASLTLGFISFPLGFNLGAYDVVFYEDVLKVVWAAVILFFVTFLQPDRPGMWITRLALISLPAWFVTAAIVVGSTGEAMERPVFAAWLAISIIVSVPLTLRWLLELFTPDVRELRNRRLAFLAGVVLVVALGGYLMGQHHPRFLTCADFSVAGASEPENCAK